MWNHIGRKLMKLSKLVCWIGIIVSLIIGLCILFIPGSVNAIRINGVNVTGLNTSEAKIVTIVTGVLVIVLGCLGSWISSWSLYALGEKNEMLHELTK